MASKTNLNKLTKIQDDSMKLIGKNLGTSNISAMYKALGIIQLPKMIQIELAKYGHRVTEKSLPTSIQNLANRNGGVKTHRYPTRNRNTPNIQKHTDHQFNSSFLCKGITVYSAYRQN